MQLQHMFKSLPIPPPFKIEYTPFEKLLKLNNPSIKHLISTLYKTLSQHTWSSVLSCQKYLE